MELKEYQQGVLRKIDHYLAILAEKRSDAEEFVEFQKSRGKEAILADYCRDTWDHLNKLFGVGTLFGQNRKIMVNLA